MRNKRKGEGVLLLSRQRQLQRRRRRRQNVLDSKNGLFLASYLVLLCILVTTRTTVREGQSPTMNVAMVEAATFVVEVLPSSSPFLLPHADQRRRRGPSSYRGQPRQRPLLLPPPPTSIAPFLSLHAVAAGSTADETQVNNEDDDGDVAAARVAAPTSSAMPSKSVEELYRTVAEQDPEWFESFVRDVLGDEEDAAAASAAAVEHSSTSATDCVSSAALDDDDILDGNNGDGSSAEAPDEDNEEDAVVGNGRQSLDFVASTAVSAADSPNKPRTTIQAVVDEEDADTADSPEVTYESSTKALTGSGENDADVEASSSEEDLSVPVNSILENHDDGTFGTDTLNRESRSAKTVSENEQVVLFKEEYRDTWTQVPMTTLTELGYSQENGDDIGTLLPDALNLIVGERIRRPRSGIPPRWRIRGEQESDDRSVKIFSADEADSFMKSREAEKQLRIESSDITSDEGQVEDEEEIEDEYDAFQSLQPSEMRSRAQSENMRSRKRRERTRYRDDGRAKPLYTGRREAPVRRIVDDPPPPKSDLWPDIDTFRGLLRNEAGLRLRILGDDFADIVKQESEWRLNLYKSWLWTLHDGVGEPIVESRRERMLRRERIRGGGNGPRQRGVRPSSTSPPSPRRERQQQ